MRFILNNTIQNVLELFMKLKLEEVFLNTLKRIRVESADYKEYIPDLEVSFGRNSPPMQPNCRLFKMNTTYVPKRIKIDLQNSENVSLKYGTSKKTTTLIRLQGTIYKRGRQFVYSHDIWTES